MSTLTQTYPHSSLEDHPRRTMLPSILDDFTIHGANGNHACYVTKLASASLSDLKDGSWIRLFQLNVARSLATQLVVVVDYVHRKGIIHGDIHLRNILLGAPSNIDTFSLEQLYEKYGAPELEPIIRFDKKPLPPSVPTHAVFPIWLGKASEDLGPSETTILLADFGEAFAPSKERKYESRAPLAIRPPETRFELHKPLSFSSDVWALACTIWSIIAQRPLFEAFPATQDGITCEHVDTLGILPAEWWERWDARKLKFDEDDSGLSSFDTKEKEAFFKMLRPMLSFRPGDRPTTSSILESEWMMKWALPEYWKCRDGL